MTRLECAAAARRWRAVIALGESECCAPSGHNLSSTSLARGGRVARSLSAIR